MNSVKLQKRKLKKTTPRRSQYAPTTNVAFCDACNPEKGTFFKKVSIFHGKSWTLFRRVSFFRRFNERLKSEMAVQPCFTTLLRDSKLNIKKTAHSGEWIYCSILIKKSKYWKNISSFNSSAVAWSWKFINSVQTLSYSLCVLCFAFESVLGLLLYYQIAFVLSNKSLSKSISRIFYRYTLPVWDALLKSEFILESNEEHSVWYPIHQFE